MIVINFLFLLSITLIFFDILLILKPKSRLRIRPKKYTYKLNNLKDQAEYRAEFEIMNYSPNKETMIPDLFSEVKFFNDNELLKIKYKTSIKIIDGKYQKSFSNYWPTKIIKARSSINIIITIKVPKKENKIVSFLWLKIIWENYGHFGFTKKEHFFLLNKDFNHSKKGYINKISINSHYEAIAIKTNLLGAFDDPVSTIGKYCKDIAQKGDILVIGETPLAIMQGRYSNPRNINYTFYTKILCFFFQPTSSLATACGMQLLINKIGITRITLSLIIGFFFKLFGINGIFYRLTAPQSSLIDDISGTTLPYDKTIVLGPKNLKYICKEISSNLNIDTAIVDVNDLGAVKIIECSNKSIENILRQTLKRNPAGNDDQKTPIVLIRKIKN